MFSTSSRSSSWRTASSMRRSRAGGGPRSVLRSRDEVTGGIRTASPIRRRRPGRAREPSTRTSPRRSSRCSRSRGRSGSSECRKLSIRRPSFSSSTVTYRAGLRSGAASGAGGGGGNWLELRDPAKTAIFRAPPGRIIPGAADLPRYYLTSPAPDRSSRRCTGEAAVANRRPVKSLPESKIDPLAGLATRAGPAMTEPDAPAARPGKAIFPAEAGTGSIQNPANRLRKAGPRPIPDCE